MGCVLESLISLVRHGIQFCLRKPRNATQLFCGGLRA